MIYYNDAYHLSNLGANLLADEILQAAPERWPEATKFDQKSSGLQGPDRPE